MHTAELTEPQSVFLEPHPCARVGGTFPTARRGTCSSAHPLELP